MDKGDGKVHLALDISQNFVSLLHSLLYFPKEIPEDLVDGLLFSSIFQAAGKGKVTEESLLEEINVKTKEYLTQPVKNFVLFSTISIAIPSKSIRFSLNKSRITFHSRPPKRFVNESSELRSDASNTLFVQPPENYGYVTVRISARSSSEAANEALDRLDLVRGMLNLGFNKNFNWRLSFGAKRNPINALILGPLHTLHFAKKGLAEKAKWWFEESYLGPVSLRNLAENDGIIFKYYKSVRKQIKGSKYRDVIMSAIVRYVRALDDRNWYVAFSKLWSVLELLTDSSKLSNEKTVVRAAFMYPDSDLARQELETLRLYRNSYVHLDKGNNQIERYMFQLKNYVENLLYFHLVEGKKFKNFVDVIAFLDLPKGKENLKKRRDLTVIALNYFDTYGRKPNKKKKK